MKVLCLVGLLAATFMKAFSEEPELGVAAPSDILCFPIDGPATFDCMATVAAGQNPRDRNALSEVVLKNDKYPNEIMSCIQGIADEIRYSYSWIGPVNTSWTEPVLNTINCTFKVALIRDLNATCTAKSLRNVTENSFSILTTKSPEKIFISQVEHKNSSIIEIEEGANATIYCTTVRSKPRLILSWNPPVGSEISSTWLTDDRGITNTSISALVTGSQALHGKRLTCIGLALPCITDSAKMTAVAIFEITYGPYELNVATKQDRFDVTFTCPLISNPPIETYNWSQDGLILNCFEKACQLSAGSGMTTITCTGSNPKSSTKATATIDITWIGPGSPVNKEDGQGSSAFVDLIIGSTVPSIIILVLVLTFMILYLRGNLVYRKSNSNYENAVAFVTDNAAKAERSDNPGTYESLNMQAAAVEYSSLEANRT